MFRSDGWLLKVNLHELKRDNLSWKKAAYYFAMNEQEILDEGRRYVFEKLMQSKAKNKIYYIENGLLKFYKARVDKYKSGLKKFKLVVYILIMLTFGQTGRGTEPISLLNSIWGIYILDGQVMTVTKYHKLMVLIDILNAYIPWYHSNIRVS